MNSLDPILRNATLEDLPILLGFEQELIKAERPFDSTLGEDPISYYDIKQMILDDDASVIVAEFDGKIIASGYAIPKKARHYLAHEQYAYLGFMYTHPDHRGKGINARIVDELKRWSLERGLKEIRLTVYSDNVPAIRAYEKVGFKRHIIEMRLE
ncbi:GNAT family N-acetyltransferase [Flagellimonas sp. HMM57]|uniref:GNAT family N-acetyltransferase n=1 Tax=unclassified Flagellimonas TaxID=2644544 RepID=UPI0013D6F29D|nr:MULTISPECIES: GNAT family N-acetyltransferase [unclassified Flagellimonas]UII76704.1 GNAT family N-acetyltransferase [Flagellimonas sp. HMM57]